MAPRILYLIHLIIVIGPVHGQSFLNENFNQASIAIHTEHPITDTVQWDTLRFPINVRATEDCYYMTTSMNGQDCRSTPGCLMMTPFYISSGFIGSSCAMLELNEPLDSGTTYVITAYIKPAGALSEYPPHVEFGFKFSSASIAPPLPQIIMRDPWRIELDSIPGTVRYIPWRSLRRDKGNPFACLDWSKQEFQFTGQGGEQYVYISIFGDIPQYDLWDVRKQITRLVHQYNRRHDPKRLAKTILKLRALFPFWPPEEVSDLELVFLASSWRYTAIADATYLIDDVSIRIKE